MMKRRANVVLWSGWPIVASAIALAVSAGIVLSGQQPDRSPVTPAPPSLAGSVSFDLYCASCHGRGGNGDGPVARSLVTPPADLTTLTRRYGGTFPHDNVLAYIEGATRLEKVHGKSDMPVWGPTLLFVDRSNGRVKVRLENLVAFIASIQAAPDDTVPARPEASGAALFGTFCASCHGPSGRGDGTIARQLRPAPPDLTKFTARNGGVFPSERVRQIIDGRGVSAHGDRNMPVWGDVFQARPAGADSAAARIDLLVSYLAMLQERTAE